MTQDDFCSENCPYLTKVPTSEKHRLPFYCELFRLFLAVENDNVCRCEQCIGKSLNANEEGYHLISSYPDPSVDKRKTKWGFRRLPKEAQDRFVRLVKQSGVTVGIEENSPLNTAGLLKSLSNQMEDLAVQEPEFQSSKKEAFNALLYKLNEDAPGLIKESTKDILTNLFLSLDASEQDLLQSMLASPGRAESLIKEVENMPSNDHMVKDFRRTLDEQQKQQELEDRQREAENRRQIQMALEQQAERQRRAEEQRRKEEEQRQLIKAAAEEAQRREQERQQQEDEQRRQEQERQREEQERKEREEREATRQREERQKEQETATQANIEKAAENSKQMNNMQMQAIHANMQGR